MPLDQWMRERASASAERCNPNVSCYVWWAWRSWAEDAESRIVRHLSSSVDDPVSRKAINRLRRLVRLVRDDLDGNRPSWLVWGNQ